MGQTILVPMRGIDLRHIYMVATPGSILIEMRIRKTVKYRGDGPLPLRSEISDFARSYDFVMRSRKEQRSFASEVKPSKLAVAK